MGNLEKLGILVIVILVVVVGVVAITPSETLFPGSEVAELTADGDTHAVDPPSIPDWPFPEPVDSAAADEPDRIILGNEPVEAPSTPTPKIVPEHEVAPAPAPAPAPATVPYVVERGDSLFKISAEQLGDGNRWREIAAVNPGLDPARIRPGQEIAIPVSAARRAPAPRIDTRVDPPVRTTNTVYVVQRGDTLSAIARERMPSKSWRKLLAANQDVLSAPEQLRPGMKLRIPE